MRQLYFFLSLLLISLAPVNASPTCKDGNTNTLAYLRRDNNRCEGLLDSRPVSGAFKLISFSTGNMSNLSDYPKSLDIRVPGTGNTLPTIIIQSFFRKYILNELEMKSSNKGFVFDLETNVLKKATIPPKSLRAIASIEQDSIEIYYPVVLGQPSGQYEFIIFSPKRTTFPTWEIRRNGKVIVSKPITIPQQDQISFIWKYGNTPQGRYELYIVDGNNKSYRFRFEHNPQWF